MNKKGQSISINTIIVAAIALAVLVVLFVIFTGRLGIFSTGVSQTTTCENSCKALGMLNGDASDKDECSRNSRTYIPGTYQELGANRVCCCLKQ